MTNVVDCVEHCGGLCDSSDCKILAYISCYRLWRFILFHSSWFSKGILWNQAIRSYKYNIKINKK